MSWESFIFTRPSQRSRLPLIILDNDSYPVFHKTYTFFALSLYLMPRVCLGFVWDNFSGKHVMTSILWHIVHPSIPYSKMDMTNMYNANFVFKLMLFVLKTEFRFPRAAPALPTRALISSPKAPEKLILLPKYMKFYYFVIIIISVCCFCILISSLTVDLFCFFVF